MADGVFPGCVALVSKNKSVLYHEAHGTLASHPMVAGGGQAVVRDTVYDLASLTKVLATTSLCALAISRGHLALLDPVPEPWSTACPGATLLDLLEHASGLVAHREYFTEVPPYDAEAVLERVAATAPEYPRRQRAIYSDLGFMILGAWLERRYDKPLDQLFDDDIAYRLGLLRDTGLELGFRRLAGLPALPRSQEGRIAPTEVYDSALHPEGLPSHFEVRKQVPYAHGAVHDDNAFVMGGVAGHAGLFGTAEAVHRVSTAWLDVRLPGLRRAVRDRFWKASDVPHSTRRLGWDGPSPDGSGSAGTAVSAAAVGHTGYTGTSLWIDPESKGGPTIMILLSNRVHPTRLDDRIKAIRPAFAEAAMRLG